MLTMTNPVHFMLHTDKIAHFRACYGVLRFVMESGAKGCEVGLTLFFYPGLKLLKAIGTLNR